MFPREARIRMTGGGAEAEPEEELSSRSSGWGSENWERSEEGRTKSKNKVLPDGFLDPLPRQKSSKLQRFSNMADRSRRACSSRHTAQHISTTVNVQPVQRSIASLGASHRAHDADQASPLVATTHLRMAREWPVECPRMICILANLGLHNLRHLQFIRLDHNLITALVERWCPLTNTFHFTTGEMTITLQDVQVLFGLRVDGPAVVGPNVVGPGRQWITWPDCCDALLGTHPGRDTVYHAPGDEEDVATFRMGPAQVESMLPLRWLRWTFYRDSYDDLAPEKFLHHVRAYIMFMIGCFLIPDTSRSHVSLQWLPLLADVHTFSRMSIGGAVLAHLYRELCHATRPTRTYIAGCVALLQVWSWERLHIGRPTLRVPRISDLAGRPLGCRWAEDRIRELPSGNTLTYRDDLDGLRMTQVSITPYTDQVLASLPQQCQDGRDIWMARVPLISWKRAEWHLPDRVMRQFGGAQSTYIEPMDQNFRRIDGRGRADLDWTIQYRDYLQLWEERRAYVVLITPPEGTGNRELGAYLRWYRSWASIYILRPQTEPPETFFSRSPGERLMADYYIRSTAIVEPLAGGEGQNASSLQLAIDQVAELSARVQQSVYIDYTTFDRMMGEPVHSRERGADLHRSQRPGRSTSDASTRSIGSRYRHTGESDLPRHSMYTPSIGHDVIGAGPSTQPWNPCGGQPSDPVDVYYGMQSQQPTTYSLFPLAIPEWMSSGGLSSSPTQQDIMLMGGYQLQQGQQVSQQPVELNPPAEEVVQEPQPERRRRKA